MLVFWKNWGLYNLLKILFKSKICILQFGPKISLTLENKLWFEKAYFFTLLNRDPPIQRYWIQLGTLLNKLKIAKTYLLCIRMQDSGLKNLAFKPSRVFFSFRLFKSRLYVFLHRDRCYIECVSIIDPISALVEHFLMMWCLIL